MKIWIYIVMFIILLSLVYGQYNTTGLDNADNFFEFTSALNDLVGDWIGIGLMIMVFVITYVSITTRYSDVLAGFGAGSFIAGLSGVILLPLGLISFDIYKVVLLIAAVSVMVSVLARPKGI